jgi:hypothetical protein
MGAENCNSLTVSAAVTAIESGRTAAKRAGYPRGKVITLEQIVSDMRGIPWDQMRRRMSLAY